MSDALAEVLSAVNRLSEKLDHHMNEEDQEIGKIFEVVNSYREESDRRHTALIQSINSYMDKQAKLEEAFIKDSKGYPDIDGHRDDHLTRLQFAQWTDEVKTDVVKGVAKAGVIAFFSWMLYVVWTAFLQGPHK